MVYSENDDYAKKLNYATWDAYIAKNPEFPIVEKLTEDRSEANSIINEWIGCFNVDITDERFTEWLKQKEVEVIFRIQDKTVDRKQGERGIYTPHDYLYQAERRKCITIGIILGYKVVGAVG